MAKRTFQQIRKLILMGLSDGEFHSFGSLERKVNTNWKTIRDHCRDLEVFNAVKIADEGVKITKLGLNAIKKL